MQAVAGKEDTPEVNGFLDPVNAMCFPDVTPSSGHFDVLLMLDIGEPGVRAVYGPNPILISGGQVAWICRSRPNRKCQGSESHGNLPSHGRTPGPAGPALSG